MLNAKEINAKIGGIRKSSAALRENIHTVLCNAAGHAYEHGDVTFFTRLLDATGGMNRKLIAQWVHTYGFATLVKDGAFKLNKKARHQADFADGAAAVEWLSNNAPRWYEGEPSKAQIAKDLDTAKAIANLTKRIKKAREQGDTVVVSFDTRKALLELGDLLVSIRDERDDENADAGQTHDNRADAAQDITPAPMAMAIAAE